MSLDVPSYLLGKKSGGGGGGGTTDYEALENKPSINGVTLTGNKTTADLNISAPTITFGTEDLIPGVSELEEGALYFVYE